jgi:hypothetical protein
MKYQKKTQTCMLQKCPFQKCPPQTCPLITQPAANLSAPNMSTPDEYEAIPEENYDAIFEDPRIEAY